MKSIIIKIRPIENRQSEYIAYCKSEFLNATYSVYFHDNIFGSVALNNFADMIRSRFDVRHVEYVIASETVSFKNPALLDVLSTGKEVRIAVQ